MKKTLSLLALISLFWGAKAQETICINESFKHTIYSKSLQEDRSYWVSLPYGYSDSLAFPVIYVLDAEWRFELIKNIVFDLGANRKMPRSIVVGIPYVDWVFQRGVDLTFSQSRMEYDGEPVDSTWYNATNSGGGEFFYKYLTQELMVDVNEKYGTNNHETLVGHSLGGYFGGYLLSLDHPFEVLHIYDPSIWYSDGEVVDRLKESEIDKEVWIHVTYQPKPAFHKSKIENFIKELEGFDNVHLSTQFYESETHNSLFMDSFYKGILITNQ